MPRVEHQPIWLDVAFSGQRRGPLGLIREDSLDESELRRLRFGHMLSWIFSSALMHWRANESSPTHSARIRP
jgi:hypothetical protein